MTQDKSDEERGFTVIDRRHGRESGEAAAAAEPEGEERAPEPPRAPPSAGEGSDSRETSSPGALPAMDFSTFLISLSTSALYHLGLVAEREGAPAPEANLPMARQTIDILEIIERKTRGNLDEEETRLLNSLLYELRLRFVEVQRRG